MKKIIVMLLIFMTPILITASENKITDINDILIYDYGEVLDEDYEEELKEKMREFKRESQMNIFLVTASDITQYNSLQNVVYKADISDNLRIGDHTIGILFFDSKIHKIYTLSNNSDWYSLDLRKFNIAELEGNFYTTSKERSIPEILDDITNYYKLKNLKNIIVIFLESLLSTYVVVRLIENKYKIKKTTEANSYIDEENIIIK